ncbi:MAG: DUF47 family protein [Desulfobacterales bacterium]|nr:DUF47 family protein [Desulfobacterales bacterium]
MGFNILDLLLPRETKFFDYMLKEAEIFLDGCRIFQQLINKIEELSEDEIKKMVWEVKQKELEGDRLERTIIDELNKTFITPLDREDIHLIVTNLDKSLDILNSLSRKLQIYKIRKVPPNVSKFVFIIVNITEQMISCLKFLETKKEVLSCIENMHVLENEADELFHRSMAELFLKEEDTLHILKFKEVYEQLESVVDSVDYIGKLVRGIKVKQG